MFARRLKLIGMFVLSCGSMAVGETVIIDGDTAIDASNSLPASVVRIVDGVSGPTTLRILDGGNIGTLNGEASELTGDSSLQIYASAAMGAITVRDRAVLEQSGGEVNAFRDELTPLLPGVMVADGAATIRIADGSVTTWGNMPGVLAQETSHVLMQGGVLTHLGTSPGIVLNGKSTVQLSGGEIVGGTSFPGNGIQASESSQVAISGGKIDASDAYAVLATDASVIDITGGELHGDAAALRLMDATRAVIAGGQISSDAVAVRLSELSHLEMTGGHVIGMRLSDTALADIRGGAVVVLDRPAGLEVFDRAEVNIDDGRFVGDRAAIQVTDAGVVNLKGGLLQHWSPDGKELVITGAGVANVFGFDLHVAGQQLSGFLANGLPMSWDLETRDAGQVVLHELPDPIVSGDFDRNEQIDAIDIDILATGVRRGSDYAPFDLNGSDGVDDADRTYLVVEILGTWFGDANLDGEFDSKDMVAAFQSGQYEDPLIANSTWKTGDWNGDAEFDSSDLILAFWDGGYGRGRRPMAAAVPEPSGPLWAELILFALCRRWPKRKRTR